MNLHRGPRPKKQETKETLKLSDRIGREQNFESKEFTLGIWGPKYGIMWQ